VSIVITGSVAYDYIMFFPGYFKDHILPDQMDRLSVSFLVDSLTRQRGGCAPNIAYSLALLGERPLVMGTVGHDFLEYRTWLESQGVDTSGIVEINGEFTASFFVSTDKSSAQIASFYTGAMSKAHTLSFHNLNAAEIELTIISPNDPAAMVKYPRECKELGIPYIYDPSQQIIRLSKDELVEGMTGARLLIVNDYEFGMIEKKTGLVLEQILDLTPTVIITRADQGSTIYTGERAIQIPAVPPRILRDPTGVGDAYRAGVIKGLVRGYSWETTGRIAALAATYVLEVRGPQNHRYTIPEFIARYRQHFGDAPELQDLVAARSVC